MLCPAQSVPRRLPEAGSSEWEPQARGPVELGFECCGSVDPGIMMGAFRKGRTAWPGKSGGRSPDPQWVASPLDQGCRNLCRGIRGRGPCLLAASSAHPSCEEAAFLTWTSPGHPQVWALAPRRQEGTGDSEQKGASVPTGWPGTGKQGACPQTGVQGLLTPVLPRSSSSQGDLSPAPKGSGGRPMAQATVSLALQGRQGLPSPRGRAGPREAASPDRSSWDYEMQ